MQENTRVDESLAYAALKKIRSFTANLHSWTNNRNVIYRSTLEEEEEYVKTVDLSKKTDLRLKNKTLDQ